MTIMSAVYKTVTTVVGRFVPQRLQPMWNHPAGQVLPILDLALIKIFSCSNWYVLTGMF